MSTPRSTATTTPLPKAEVERRIAELRRRRVAVSSAREDLDRPLDPQIRVDASPGRHRLVLVVDGVEVSWATVVDFRQRVGSGAVRMGGIAGVGTRDDQRFKGYSRRVLESCLRWMRAVGYHTTMLYGIPSFYPKYGYAKAFPRTRFTMAVRDAEALDGGPFNFVPFQADAHLSSLLMIYAKANAVRTGTLVRTRGRWQPFRKGLSWSSEAKPEVALDARGRMAGYIVFHGQHLTATVLEAAGATPAVFPALLRRAAQKAWDQRLESIDFRLAEDDALMRYAATFGVRKDVTYGADGDAMVRLINLPAALQALRTELGRRTQGSGTLTVLTNLDSVSVTWRDGQVSVGPPVPTAPTVRLPQWAMAQFLYGYRSVDDARAAGAIRGSARALAAFTVLFPPGPHHLYAVDEF